MHAAAAARRGGPADPSGDPVERRPRRRRMRRAGTGRARARGDRRRGGDAGVHRAQASVAEAPRAGELRPRPHRARRQGLHPHAPHRRIRHRHGRRCRHADARRGGARPGRHKLVAASGIDEDALPKALEGPTWSGMVRPEILAEWGIAHQVVVAAGAGDVAAGAIGIGAINDGDQFISLGTSAQIFVARDRYQPRPGTLIHAFAHGVPERWFEMAALLNGAVMSGMAGARARRERRRGARRPGRTGIRRPLAGDLPALPRRRAFAPQRPGCARRLRRARPGQRRRTT